MKSPACHGFDALRLSRRQLIKAGGMGALGLTLPKILAGSQYPGGRPPARAKSVIFLFQWGGPSHVDMFDLKPGAPSAYRTPHKAIRTSNSELLTNEHLPRVAKIMDRFTVIRSVHHGMKNHNSAGYYALSGHAPPTDDQRLRDSIDLRPAYGSVIDRFAPNPEGGLPTFVTYPHVVADGSRTPGQAASFLGKKHDPLFVPRDPNDPNFKLPELSLPSNLSLDRLHARRGLQELVDRQSRLLDHSAEARGLDDYYKSAIAMLNSERVRQAFDISSEPQKIRDAYGRTTYGQGCLLARRLVEHGVKFVTCYFSSGIGGQSITEGGWDTHGFNDTRMFPIVEQYHYPVTETTLPTLIYDLENRGLLDETLVVWMGEFGRTPKINKNASRDHWPNCYSVLLAGGGVKRGYIHGASDETGSNPIEKPVKLEDLSATIYYLLGIDPTSEYHDTQGRPLMISSGNPILDVVA